MSMERIGMHEGGSAPRKFHPLLGCEECPRRERCTVPCEELEKMLPHTGKEDVLGYGVPSKEKLLKTLRGRKMLRILMEYRSRLRGIERQVFDRIYNRGMKYRETAADLGITLSAVRTAINNAYRRIAKWTRRNR